MTKEEFLENLLNEDKPRYGMFTRAGDRRVHTIVKRCVKKLFGKAMRQADFEKFVSLQVQKITNGETHHEITDTAVRECIYFDLEKAIELDGYNWDEFEYSAYK